MQGARGLVGPAGPPGAAATVVSPPGRQGRSSQEEVEGSTCSDQLQAVIGNAVEGLRKGELTSWQCSGSSSSSGGISLCNDSFADFESTLIEEMRGVADAVAAVARAVAASTAASTAATTSTTTSSSSLPEHGGAMDERGQTFSLSAKEVIINPSFSIDCGSDIKNLLVELQGTGKKERNNGATKGEMDT